MHFYRLGKLARRSAIATSLLSELANTKPYHRALSFLLLQDSGETRELFQAHPSLFQSLKNSVGNLHACPYIYSFQNGRLFPESDPKIIEMLRSSLATLEQGELLFFNQLQIGAYLITEDQTSNRTSEEICSGVCRMSVGQLSNPTEVLRVSAAAFFSAWSHIETRATNTMPEASHAEQFGEFAALEFESRGHKALQRKIAVGEPPMTPMCRDLWQAWLPKSNRHEATIGSPVNHCVSLEDVIALWKAKS